MPFRVQGDRSIRARAAPRLRRGGAAGPPLVATAQGTSIRLSVASNSAAPGKGRISLATRANASACRRRIWSMRSGDLVAHFAQQRIGEQTARHADAAENAPHFDVDSRSAERLVPSQDMLIDAVDKRAVEIEQESGSDLAPKRRFCPLNSHGIAVGRPMPAVREHHTACLLPLVGKTEFTGPQGARP